MHSTNPTSNGEAIPFAEDAERRYLGAVLLDWRKHWRDGLGPDNFHDERHKLIFGKMLSLNADGSPIEVLTVKDALPPVLWPYLSELPDGVPADPELEHFTSQLHDALFMRRMQQAVRHGNATEVLTATRRAVAALEKTARDDGNLPMIQDACAPVETARPAELISGLLHQGSKLVLGGGSKSFKTFTLTDLALSVAYGRQWLGKDTRPGRVLYLNFEIQPVFFADRIAAIAGAKGIAHEPGHLDVWNLRGYAAEAGIVLPEIERKTSKTKYALIVLDPIYKLYGAVDENKAGDVARLLNHLEHLAVSSGAAVAFGAHFSKGNQAAKESIDRISGSGVFARDPDSLLIFTPHQEPEAFTVEPTLRNFAPVQPFVVRWEYPLMRRDGELDPTKLKQAKGRPTTHSEDELFKLLPPTGLTTSEWLSMADVECGIARSTFHRLRKSLEVNNRVLKSKASDKWTPVSKVP